MYLFLWLYLEYTSKNASRCVRYGACATVGPEEPLRPAPGGHVPDPLAIIQGHQPGVCKVPSGQPRGAVYLILWLFLKDTSQASAGCPQASSAGAVYLILWLLLKDTSQAFAGCP